MGVVQDLYTLGFTYALSKDLDLRMASMHANSNSATGSSLRNGLGVPAGTEEIERYEIPWALPGCCGCGSPAAHADGHPAVCSGGRSFPPFPSASSCSCR